MSNRGNEHCGSEENGIDVVAVIWESLMAMVVVVVMMTRMGLKNV